MNYSLDRIAKKNLYNRDRLKYSGETKRLKGLVVTKPFQILDFWFCRNICPWFFLHKSCFSGTFLYKVQTGFLYFSAVTHNRTKKRSKSVQTQSYLIVITFADFQIIVLRITKRRWQNLRQTDMFLRDFLGTWQRQQRAKV